MSLHTQTREFFFPTILSKESISGKKIDRHADSTSIMS